MRVGAILDMTHLQTLLLETGLLACVIVVIVAQLTPQIVASIYPVGSSRQ